MCVTNRSQLVLASRAEQVFKKLPQNESDSALMASQLALDHSGILRCFLFICALRCMSTSMIPSWSEIPGMVSMVLTADGLLTQKRSRIASSLVHSLCIWCKPASPRIEMRSLQRPFFLHSWMGTSIFQSISRALKSPATITDDLGEFIIVQTLSEDIELIKCLSDIVCRVCE